MPPSTSATLLRENALSTSPMIHIIVPFWFSIRNSFQASYPFLNVKGHSWSFGVPCFSLWLPWPSGLCLLLHHSLSDGAVTFLHSFPQSFYLCMSPGPVKQASEVKLNISCPMVGKPLIPQTATKEQDGLPWGQEHTFSYLARPPGVCQ